MITKKAKLSSSFVKKLSLFILLPCLFTLSACDNDSTSTKHEDKSYSVEVLEIKPTVAPINLKLNGKVSAYAKADVRPQVSGIIKERLFTEGQEIKAGVSLYQIDDIKYKAKYDLAKANLSKAQNTKEQAYTKYMRYKALNKKKAVSEQEYDDVKLAYLSAVDDEAIALANLIEAKANLEYTKVKAPISGIVGKSNVTKGALVTENQSETLTSIVDLSKVYVDVQQSASSWRLLNQKINDGSLASAQSNKVKLIFDDGTSYPLLGELSLSEIQVDDNSGSVTLRAIFENPKRLLLPGMAVSAHLEGALQENVIVIPASALIRNANGKAFVFLVNDDNTVTRQEVVASDLGAFGYVIESGLEVGECIVKAMVGTLKTGTKISIKNAKEPKSKSAL